MPFDDPAGTPTTPRKLGAADDGRGAGPALADGVSRIAGECRWVGWFPCRACLRLIQSIKGRIRSSPAIVRDVSEVGSSVRLGGEEVISVSDPSLASAGPDTVVDENQLEELIIEAQTALPVELPDLANRCASVLAWTPP
ncbi:hypothetical protein [Streptomyces spiralis]|uniref:hypothetical protein n=1 Tax=Streptomyces spiralis TaxID=66376 RepID=UPI003F4D4B1F